MYAIAIPPNAADNRARLVRLAPTIKAAQQICQSGLLPDGVRREDCFIVWYGDEQAWAERGPAEPVVTLNGMRLAESIARDLAAGVMPRGSRKRPRTFNIDEGTYHRLLILGQGNASEGVRAAAERAIPLPGGRLREPISIADLI